MRAAHLGALAALVLAAGCSAHKMSVVRERAASDLNCDAGRIVVRETRPHDWVPQYAACGCGRTAMYVWYQEPQKQSVEQGEDICSAR